MAAYMQYTAAFVQQIDAVQHFPAEDIHFPVERQRWEFFAGFYIMLHFFEYPGASEAGTSDHDGIYPIEVKTFFGTLRCGYISIADDRNMYARILLYLAYQGPIRFTGIHLCTCASVDG